MYRIIMFLLLCLPMAISAQEYQSRWQQATINIDGNLDDWDERPGLFDSKSGLLYGMRNDSSNIYFCFEVDDKLMQRKVIHAGLTLKLTSKVKPKTSGLISFQAVVDNTKKPKDDKQMANDDLKQSYRLINPPLLCEGFIHSNGIVQPGESELERLSFAVDWNKNNDMVIELKIPINDLFHEDLSPEEIAEAKIIMQASVAALSRPSNNQNQGGGGMGQGMGGPPGGGGGSGPPSGGMHDDAQSMMSTAQHMKNKFTLTFRH